MNKTELNFTFLRDVDCVQNERQYTKAETYYAGSVLFTNIESMNLIKDGLALKGYELINLIIKGNGLYNKTKDLLDRYIKNGSTKGEIYIDSLIELKERLRVKTTMNIERFQRLSVIYNELKFHKDSFDVENEKVSVYSKVDNVLFDRFRNDDWIAPEDEDYNKPPKKLKVEYNQNNVAEYLESYISEFMEELNGYLEPNKDKNIIDSNLIIFDSEDIFKELEIDFYLRDSYNTVKHSLIDFEECEKICSNSLLVDDIGKRLKEARYNALLTMMDVSRITCLSPAYISRLENNSRMPSIEALFKLCIAYNIDIGSFLTNQKLNALDDGNKIDLNELLSCPKVNLGEDNITTSDKEEILKFAKLLVQSKSDETKSAIKNILDGVRTLL